MSEKNPNVATRLDAAAVVRVDALKKALSTQHVDASRSDVLRALVLHSLPLFEREHGIPVEVTEKAKGRAGK